MASRQICSGWLFHLTPWRQRMFRGTIYDHVYGKDQYDLTMKTRWWPLMWCYTSTGLLQTTNTQHLIASSVHLSYLLVWLGWWYRPSVKLDTNITFGMEGTCWDTYNVCLGSILYPQTAYLSQARINLRLHHFPCTGNPGLDVGKQLILVAWNPVTPDVGC